MTAGIIVVLLTAALAACGGDNGESGSGEEASGGEPVTVGLALVGSRNDGSFVEATFNGAQEAAAEIDNVELTSTVDNLSSPEEQFDALRSLAETNDFVIAGNALLAEPAGEVAQQFPDTHFAVIGELAPLQEDLDNMTSVVFEEGLPSVVVGVVAGNLTETGSVGFVGGEEIPLAVQSREGYEFGAKTVDENIEVQANIVGDFNDAAKAKSAAQGQIADGADQIYAWLDAGVRGVYQAAEESDRDVGVYQIVAPRCDEHPSVRGAMVLNIGGLVFGTIEDFANGQLEPGGVYWGMSNPDVMGFELCPDAATPELEREAEDTIQQINDGDLEVPASARYERPDFPITEK